MTNKKTTTTAFIMLLLAVTTTSAVSYAQTTPTPTPTPSPPSLPAPTLEELSAEPIEPGGEFAVSIVLEQQTACGARLLSDICVGIKYASANIVVLEGELLPELQVNRRFDNKWIWNAVDQIKAQGFSIQHVSILGEGTEMNPSRLYIVMAK